MEQVYVRIFHNHLCILFQTVGHQHVIVANTNYVIAFGQFQTLVPIVYQIDSAYILFVLEITDSRIGI